MIAIGTLSSALAILALCSVFHWWKDRRHDTLTDFAKWVTSTMAMIAAVLLGFFVFMLQTSWSDDQARQRLDRLLRIELNELSDTNRRYYEFLYQYTKDGGGGPVLSSFGALRDQLFFNRP